MVTEYIAAGAIAVALTGGGYGYIQSQKNETLRTQVEQMRGELLTCGARLQNILEDLYSDREIDNLPDDALRVVPDHWLRVVPAPAPG